MGNLCKTQLSEEIQTITKVDKCVERLVALGYDEVQSRGAAKVFDGDLEKCIVHLQDEQKKKPMHSNITQEQVVVDMDRIESKKKAEDDIKKNALSDNKGVERSVNDQKEKKRKLTLEGILSIAKIKNNTSKKDVHEIKGKVQERGKKLAEVADKSDELASSSQKFDNLAKQLMNKKW